MNTKLLVTIFLLCLVNSLLVAQDVALTPAQREAVDQAVAKQMQQQNLVGVCVGVIAEGQLAYSKGYGFQDREENIHCSTDTMFRWASISKPVTAVAAMQLVEQGKLRLDDDVRKYVPEFPDNDDTVTVRDLMCHQSGIVHYTNGKVVRTKRKYVEENPFEDVVLALDRFRESPLVHPPGEKYSYSTHAYILLSAVVQRAGDQKFADQVAERIAKPLGLTTLQPDYQWVEIPHRSVGYRKGRNDESPKVSSNTDVSWKLGGGGFISSIDDLAGFGVGVINKELLHNESFETMWIAQELKSGDPTNVGLGFFIDRSNGVLKVSHNGAQEKTRTRLVLYPESKRGLAVMCNTEHCDPGRITTAIIGALNKLQEEEQN